MLFNFYPFTVYMWLLSIYTWLHCLFTQKSDHSYC